MSICSSVFSTANKFESFNTMFTFVRLNLNLFIFKKVLWLFSFNCQNNFYICKMLFPTRACLCVFLRLAAKRVPSLTSSSPILANSNRKAKYSVRCLLCGFTPCSMMDSSVLTKRVTQERLPMSSTGPSMSSELRDKDAELLLLHPIHENQTKKIKHDRQKLQPQEQNNNKNKKNFGLQIVF